ncbi:MAG: DUF2292 domain-containing protein [Verrucomicrobia bacterium]|jgi:hypothetical protein|nr:MAG: DUF2292 domain-containing protein [Verrucomicrobiota bacterium]
MCEINENNDRLPLSEESWVEVVVRDVSRIRYGTVQLYLQDGVVVYSQCTEKFRFEAKASDARKAKNKKKNQS